MSRGVNMVILVGNLGHDPEISYTPEGKAIANLSLATSESWKDKETGDEKEKVEWHKIVTFGKLAEICKEYLKKGSKIYIEGQLNTQKWNDKNTNEERYSTKIIGRRMEMLGGLPSVNISTESIEQDIPF